MNLIKLISDLKEHIKRAIMKCQADLGVGFKISEINLEIPEQKIHGDISTNAALEFSKLFRVKPLVIASSIVQNFDKLNYIERIEIAQPGFINFFLDKKFFFEVLREIDDNFENYGRMPKKNKQILVEFVSANPTGPMHVGNARLGVLGDSLSEVLKFAGFEVYKEFYVNDAGNQIEKFADSLIARYLQIFDSSIEFPEDGYQGDYIKQIAEEFKNIYGDKYSVCSRKILQDKILDFALPESINKMKNTLSSYKINYDNWFYESSLYESGEITSVLKKFKEKNATYTKDNAVWFKATDFGAQKDEVLVRNNGIPTYFAADIAYHVNKFLVRKFDICINFLGADHQGHIPRMHAAMKCLGVDSSRLIFIIVQFVRIIKKHQIFVMSKREGKIETLEDFINQMSVDCSRFIFNMQTANSAMDFDISAVVKNDSNNPSYYVKYACVRIQSILRQFDRIPERENIDFELLNSEIERELMLEVARFPVIVEESVNLLDSTRLARYVVNLAAIFHKFYNTNKVKNDDYSLSNARYFLCLQILRVIKIVLKILKIDIPRKM